MSKTFAVFRSPGSEWVVGTPVREQPLWNEHAAFMDNLFKAGHILLGGPYAEHPGSLLIVEAEHIDIAGHLFDDDPWTKESILDAGEVKEWTIFLDSRQKT
jgi:uncharacterized protein YciI